MTVKEYIDSLEKSTLKPVNPGDPSFADICMDSTEIWSNAACKGYAIRACRSLDFSREQTEALLQAMGWAFDDISVEEAEEEYEKF